MLPSYYATKRQYASSRVSRNSTDTGTSKPWLAKVIAQKNLRSLRVGFGVLVTLFLLSRLNNNTFWPTSLTISSDRARLFRDIQNSTLGFQRIIAINHPYRTDHRDGLVLASAASDLKINYIDGVNGDTIPDKVLPAKHNSNLNSAIKGSRRAHLNAISQVVEHGLTSALIIEDDADWDIRLKSQLQDFALASHFILTEGYLGGVTTFSHIQTNSVPKLSPYGAGWDVLWLGHCGMELPEDNHEPIVLHENDETVPETWYQKSHDVNATSSLAEFAQHTRVISYQSQGTCSLAYAVSQAGARKLLLSLGLHRADMAFDLLLREWCQRGDGIMDHVCIGVLPQLFGHHRRIGSREGDGDISAPDQPYRERAYTFNIRWSVRMNMDKLLEGETDYDDQWPDS